MTVPADDPDPRPDATLGWRTRDWVSLVGVTVVAAGVRGVRLTTPHSIYFDENYYAVDACLYVRTYRGCAYAQRVVEVSSEHPPLGKWIIGLGIQAFGNDPLGWRVPSLIAGTLTVVVVFLLGRVLLRSTVAATVAAGLLATDFLHLVQSRIAMLDVFVTLFTTETFLFVLYDSRFIGRSWLPPWRVAAGLAGGAATATKWAGALALIAALGVATYGDLKRRRSGAAPGRAADDAEWPWAHSTTRRVARVAVPLVLIPAVTYVATFVGRVHGSLLAAPWDSDSWVRTFLGVHRRMASFHLNLGDSFHQYASPAWSWLLLKRPVTYFFEATSGEYREVLAVGNPLVWWPASLTLALALWCWWRH